MLYYLFEWLHFDASHIPGAGLFRFITFRAIMALVVSLLMSLLVGKRIIRLLQRRLIGESIRTTGPESHFSKKGTPTMGGIILLVSIIVPTLLFARIANVYVYTMILSTVWMGIIGFSDDYIKVFRKNKEGLKGTYKVYGQIGLGLLIGAVLYFHPDSQKALLTNLPITRSTLDYGAILPLGRLAWLLYLPIIILIVTAVTNAVNLTDGIDGLAAGTTAIIGVALGILAYMAGNARLANYLHILHIPHHRRNRGVCGLHRGGLHRLSLV